MTDAPERMYADHGLIGWQFKGRNEAGLTEYIRADVHAAEITRLRGELAAMGRENNRLKYGPQDFGGALMQDVLADAVDRAEAAEAALATVTAERDEWKLAAEQSKEAVEHLRAGKPMGEIVGMHMIHNMSVEQARLQTRAEAAEAALATARADGLETAAEILDRRHSGYMLGKGRDPKQYHSDYAEIAATIRALIPAPRGRNPGCRAFGSDIGMPISGNGETKPAPRRQRRMKR